MHASPYLFNGTELVFALVSAIALSTALGLFLGRRWRADRGVDERSELYTIIGAVLGLFGLLLGFSLSMAVIRHDARKVSTVEEANAVGTTFLRTALLSTRGEKATRGLMREYVQADAQLYEAIDDPLASQRIGARLQELQDELWEEARTEAALEPRAVTTGLFVQSLNNLIDSHATRVATFRNSLPPILLLLLCVFALVGSGLNAYATGLMPGSNRVPALLAALMTLAVLLTVFDIDRPLQGSIQVGQRPLTEARDYVLSHSR
jgi:hypothetical protein